MNVNTCSEPIPGKSSCLNIMTSNTADKANSQALLGEGCSDIFSQGGKLRRFKQVDAARGGDVAEPPGRSHAGSARRLGDDFSAMVHAGLCMLSETEFLAVDLDVTSSRHMVGIFK